MVSGEELRRKREKAGLTQEQLAKKLDVHINTIYNWESETVTIRKPAQLALEKIFSDLN